MADRRHARPREPLVCAALLESREVGRKPLGVELGHRFVFWRTADGRLQAQNDRCPHLVAALSAGSVQHDRIVCPFHGFQFDASGVCRYLPAIGRDGSPPATLSVVTFPVRELHGFVWLWWGDPRLATDAPVFFETLGSGWRHFTVSVEWPVHYTRAIENQLDVAHLAFVHRTTIGAGGRSCVDGPHVEANAGRLRVWVTNRRDDGTPARGAQALAAAAAAVEPSLDFRFPGIWLLNISPRFKNFIAFVPINEQRTRYYLRSYRAGRGGWPTYLFDWLMSWANRFILNQDRRVVVTQMPPDSAQATDDHLMGMDRAIIQFRRFHGQMMARASAK